MKKITQKEFTKFVESRLYSEGFSKTERDTLMSAFFSDLQDAEPGESGVFTGAVPGISSEELKKRMAELRDPNSLLSKGLKFPFYKYPDRLNKVEKIMTEALEGDKESWF